MKKFNQLDRKKKYYLKFFSLAKKTKAATKFPKKTFFSPPKSGLVLIGLIVSVNT